MFKLLKAIPSFSSMLAATLLVLLAVLATLQYSWLGSVSQGEREAMRVSLQTKTRSFCAAFDREITRAYAMFKMNADTFRAENRNGFYAERLDKWTKTSPYPGIVKGLFLVESGDNGGQLRLLRFSEREKAFEPVEWTPDLESLRDRFEQQRQNEDTSPRGIFGGANSVAEDVPALVSSIVTTRTVDAKNDYKRVDWQHPLGDVIVVLDLNYIKEKVFPDLAKTYYSSGEAIDYDLNIASRVQPQKLIYRSNSESEFTDDPSAMADAKDKLFNIGFDQVKSYTSERVYNTANSSKKDESRYTLVIPALKDDGEKTDQEENASKVLLIDDSARWELKVNHRMGSLDAAVANARHWNLAISFGILLLLGGSVVLIAALSRHSQKLARRQIEFVAGVSHEFRTPLAVIYSLSENLAAGRIRDSQQVERYGATIHKDVRRLTEMVEQVLEFAGAERGKYFYDKIPVDVRHLIEKVLSANAPLLQENNWRVEKKFEPGLPLVSADESALERAIQNLIGNAVKYGGTADSRWLKIEVYRATNSQKPEINIVIEDNGDGIAPAELPYIFEPFFRGQQATLAQIHGSGLGLNLVKQIVEAHGGRIAVESATRRGCRFVLHLPAVVAKADSPSISEVL